MPHRIQAMHEGLAMLLGATSALVASIMSFLAEVPVEAFSGPAILDNERLRVVCLIGAIGGAILNLGIYPSKLPGIRPLVWKFTASVMCGVVFTPMVVHWTGVTANFDTLAFTSFIMAISGVGIVVKLIPAIQRFIFSKLGISTADPEIGPQGVLPPGPAPVNPPGGPAKPDSSY